MEECEEWSFLQETVQQRRRKELQEQEQEEEEQEEERPWTGEIDW
jgi:hypothetical protein